MRTRRVSVDSSRAWAGSSGRGCASRRRHRRRRHRRRRRCCLASSSRSLLLRELPPPPPPRRHRRHRRPASRSTCGSGLLRFGASYFGADSYFGFGAGLIGALDLALLVPAAAAAATATPRHRRDGESNVGLLRVFAFFPPPPPPPPSLPADGESKVGLLRVFTFFPPPSFGDESKLFSRLRLLPPPPPPPPPSSDGRWSVGDAFVFFLLPPPESNAGWSLTFALFFPGSRSSVRGSAFLLLLLPPFAFPPWSSARTRARRCRAGWPALALALLAAVLEVRARGAAGAVLALLARAARVEGRVVATGVPAVAAPRSGLVPVLLLDLRELRELLRVLRDELLRLRLRGAVLLRLLADAEVAARAVPVLPGELLLPGLLAHALDVRRDLPELAEALTRSRRFLPLK